MKRPFLEIGVRHEGGGNVFCVKDETSLDRALVKARECALKKIEHKCLFGIRRCDICEMHACEEREV